MSRALHGIISNYALLPNQSRHSEVLVNGVLYVVATPIGNLKDITFRAVEVLGSVDMVIAEDRERALKLLSHLGIRKPITTINSFNEERKAPRIAALIEAGQSCALISAAGTPCVSDPGGHIVRRCMEEGLEVAAVPGPSSAISAFAISGVKSDKFLFYGFLPQKKGRKRRVLEELADFLYPIIFFESPRRLIETLNVLSDMGGERNVVVLKELTKVHEKTFRGPVRQVVEELSGEELRGEYTLILDCSEK
jgi:16S rRNA (cytidine1402-2'-O)-methyltransferase